MILIYPICRLGIHLLFSIHIIVLKLVARFKTIYFAILANFEIDRLTILPVFFIIGWSVHFQNTGVVINDPSVCYDILTLYL